MSDAERPTKSPGMAELEQISLEVANGSPPARPDPREEARFREMYPKKLETMAAETQDGDRPSPAPVYYLKGCDESVWREPSGNRNVAPGQVLKPGGWADVGPMDPKAWLTNSNRATADEARKVAAELGLPTDVFG